jgi:hypothetical protein
MTALWPIVHRCGHQVEWDLSRKHPSDRAGFARWLALRDCTACRWAKRRDHHQPSERHRRTRAHSVSIDDWEDEIGMPALSGSDKAGVWARKIRHRLLTAALPPSVAARGTTDETVLALIADARTITVAGWWIDHRKIEPRHLAAALEYPGSDAALG